MRVQTIGAAALVFILLSAAVCGAAESDRAIGVWKSVERENGKYVFIELTEDTVDIDGRQNDVVLEERDGRVSVRIAGRDDIVAVIKVVDDATIEASLSSRNNQKLRLSRSSREEWAAADAPPIDNILGLWRSEEGDAEQGTVTTLEIARDSVSINGTRTDAIFGTRKGLYTIVINGDDDGTIAVNNNDSIVISFGSSYYRMDNRAVDPSMIDGMFIRTTREELAVLTSAAEQTLWRYFGVWRSKGAGSLASNAFGLTRNAFDFIEIGDRYVVINGERSAAKMEMTSDGLVATDGNGIRTHGKLLDDNTAVFEYPPFFENKEMVRSSSEEREIIRNPNISAFEGLWLPEDGAPTYRTLAIEKNTIEREGTRQPFAVDDFMVRSGQLRLNRKQYGREFLLCDLHYLGSDRIGVSDHGYMNTYRRASPEEFAAVAKSLGEPFGGVQGYWRSADPVADGGIHATMRIEREVRDDDRIFDRITHHFIDRRNFEPEYRLTIITSKGVLGYRGADTSTPILLISSSDDRGYSTGMSLKMLDANTLEVNYGSGNRLVKMIRSTKEEVDAIRETVRKMTK